MTIKNKKIERYGSNNLLRNKYQGHIVWCLFKDSEGQCYGVNFLSLKSYETKWISRILNDPTLNYVCRWCGTKGSFNSIMFMNDELNPTFYREFREGKIDNCVSYISRFLWKNGHKVRKESLKTVMNELFTYEESLDED